MCQVACEEQLSGHRCAINLSCAKLAKLRRSLDALHLSVQICRWHRAHFMATYVTLTENPWHAFDANGEHYNNISPSLATSIGAQENANSEGQSWTSCIQEIWLPSQLQRQERWNLWLHPNSFQQTHVATYYGSSSRQQTYTNHLPQRLDIIVDTRHELQSFCLQALEVHIICCVVLHVFWSNISRISDGLNHNWLGKLPSSTLLHWKTLGQVARRCLHCR